LNFTETPLAGAYVIDATPITDTRGCFARTYCTKEFAEHGLVTHWVQCNTSYNARTGTLRGLHFQRAPHQEVKLVRCTRGSVFDVAVDIRAGSATYGQWHGVELSAENRRSFYIPAGFAHGYQALVDDSEVFYQVSAFYHPQSEGGLRWNDPAFNIAWPLADQVSLSPKDSNWPLLSVGSPENVI
jgi:dTDP-4-dehydrorhamnose 3,5-epimerase